MDKLLFDCQALLLYQLYHQLLSFKTYKRGSLEVPFRKNSEEDGLLVLTVYQYAKKMLISGDYSPV
jgi:hypothetical protein